MYNPPAPFFTLHAKFPNRDLSPIVIDSSTATVKDVKEAIAKDFKISVCDFEFATGNYLLNMRDFEGLLFADIYLHYRDACNLEEGEKIDIVCIGLRVTNSNFVFEESEFGV
ncbi:hypothetical protein GGI00_006080, partial [Coemansia sp. RSA 2681]